MLRPLMTVLPLPPSIAPSGAAMDRPAPARSRRPRIVAAAAAVVTVLVGGGLAWAWRGPAPAVALTPQFAAVAQGEFRDELALRGRVEPMRSVQLDATESGRVEAVLARDGEVVEAGAPLYRLDSPEREQLLLQRGAEVAQQMANASAQRSAQATSLAQSRRELAQLASGVEQAQAEWQRQRALADAGFISPAALEQADRARRLATTLLSQAREDQRAEAEIRAQSLAEMDRAVLRLQGGLRLLERAQERLLQRAPIAGQISGFQLQVGASVRAGDRLGRIDDPDGGLRVVADIDEFYLSRLRPGLRADSERGPLELVQTLPQVQDGKVRALLRWRDPAAAAALRPGQALDLKLAFTAPRQAMSLPDGPGVQARLYVRQGDRLFRREVRLGGRAAGRVEVLAGLRPGDQVLISQPPSDADVLALP
ncbi:efflux RND transporter periplasmic adaptor subunit [Roseateles chitosanitabidus]|uniref:efflux RND transporter periplasmic adaptor subunit n=1 Tax=Roseateles chitosanitabidus TaxID=65048 RepID=UPI00147196F5|nr:HlyD family efflux transporter periplasmic adaptor subunit [Roseateles chitosanitabidus]